MKLAAFDPGKLASWALYDSERPWDVQLGELRQVGIGRDLRPCGLHILEIIREADVVIVEKVGAMPGQGVSSVFTFGLVLGTILGSVQTTGKGIERPTPREWKASSGLGNMEKEAAKTAARHLAKELWPSHAKIFDMKSKHGIAEAALMLRWYCLDGPGRGIPLEKDHPLRAPLPAQ